MSNQSNDLSEGFKITELGPLPEDWEVISFNESMGKRTANIPDSIQRHDYKPMGKYPIVDQSEKYIAGYTDNSEKIYSLERPIIIFGDHTRIFKFIDFHFALGADGTKILNPNSDLFDPKYFYFYLTNLDIPSRGYNRHFKMLKEKKVVKPPLPEQKAIARVLSAIQKAVEAQDKIITAARELKKSLMRHLFTYGPVPVSEAEKVSLKETEIGQVPELWDVVRLGDTCKISTGTTPSTEQTDYYRGNIPFIKTTEIVNNVIRDTSTFISEQAVKDYNLKTYKPGTVFLAMYGQGKTRGQVAFLSIAATTTQNTAAIQPSDILDGQYLWMYLMSKYEVLRSLGHQGHISHLNLGYVKQIQIPLPSIDEQREIVCMVRVVENKIESEENRKAALQGLFKTMMHQLMTGKVRVNNLEAQVL